MKLIALCLLALLLSTIESKAQPVPVPSTTTTLQAAPNPSAACTAPTTSNFCFQWYDGSKWNVVNVQPPTGSAFTVSGSTVTLPSSSGGGGTTYTAGPGIQINGTVISAKGPVIRFSANKMIASTDMLTTWAGTGTTPLVVTLPAASTVVAGGNDICFVNQTAPSLSFAGAAIIGTPTSLLPNQGICLLIDDGGNWGIFRGVGQ